jgi:hypothetical protein
MHPGELTSNRTSARIVERILFYVAFPVIPCITTCKFLLTRMLMVTS